MPRRELNWKAPASSCSPNKVPSSRLKSNYRRVRRGRGEGVRNKNPRRPWPWSAVLLRQHHRKRLVIRLDRHGDRLALIDRLLGKREVHDNGSLLLRSREQLGFGQKRRLGILLQCGKGLEIALEIYAGCGFVFEAIAVLAGNFGLDSVDPKRLLSGVMQSQGDGHHGRVLARHFDGGDAID